MNFAKSSLTAALSVLAVAGSASAADLGKKACAQEAKKLCPSEMRSMSRKKVEACMIVRIVQTSPTCHAAMLTIKAQHDAALKH